MQEQKIFMPFIRPIDRISMKIIVGIYPEVYRLKIVKIDTHGEKCFHRSDSVSVNHNLLN